MRLAAGLRPHPLEELKRSPRPPSRKRGPTSKGRVGGNLLRYMCTQIYLNVKSLGKIIAKTKWCDYFGTQCRRPRYEIN